MPFLRNDRSGSSGHGNFPARRVRASKFKQARARLSNEGNPVDYLSLARKKQEVDSDYRRKLNAGNDEKVSNLRNLKSVKNYKKSIVSRGGAPRTDYNWLVDRINYNDDPARLAFDRRMVDSSNKYDSLIDNANLSGLEVSPKMRKGSKLSFDDPKVLRYEAHLHGIGDWDGKLVAPPIPKPRGLKRSTLGGIHPMLRINKRLGHDVSDIKHGPFSWPSNVKPKLKRSVVPGTLNDLFPRTSQSVPKHMIEFEKLKDIAMSRKPGTPLKDGDYFMMTGMLYRKKGDGFGGRLLVRPPTDPNNLFDLDAVNKRIVETRRNAPVLTEEQKAAAVESQKQYWLNRQHESRVELFGADRVNRALARKGMKPPSRAAIDAPLIRESMIRNIRSTPWKFPDYSGWNPHDTYDSFRNKNKFLWTTTAWYDAAVRRVNRKDRKANKPFGNPYGKRSLIHVYGGVDVPRQNVVVPGSHQPEFNIPYRELKALAELDLNPKPLWLDQLSGWSTARSGFREKPVAVPLTGVVESSKNSSEFPLSSEMENALATGTVVRYNKDYNPYAVQNRFNERVKRHKPGPTSIGTMKQYYTRK
jgi:hypothetical protein